MPPLILFALLAALPGPSCAIDETKMMSLTLREFDQDLQGGWRSVARIPKCRKAAADLIGRYRKKHGATSTLYWHEGQLRAEIGERHRAIRLFNLARHPAANDSFGWNHYVDGSIAFLKRDRKGLLAARDKLAALPKPEGFNPIGPSGAPINVAWPPNLNVLDGMIACFGKPYEEAYGRCAKPIMVVP